MYNQETAKLMASNPKNVASPGPVRADNETGEVTGGSNEEGICGRSVLVRVGRGNVDVL